MGTKIAILDDYQSVALDFGPWHEVGGDAEVTVFTEPLASPAHIVEALRPFDVIVAMRERTPFPAEVLQKLSNLKHLVTTGMANAAIEMDAARQAGITVTGTPSAVMPAVEVTWALILALARNVCSEDRGMRTGDWQSTIGSDLAGSTLGVVGLGKIGTRVAAIGRAFGMHVVAWSQNLNPVAAIEQGVEPVGKDDLLAKADFVSLHLVLSDRTRGLIQADDLRRMKATAYLVNTSRAMIVDETALLTALNKGEIAGAGLDVFAVEPLPLEHPIRVAPRTVLTPHIGFVTRRGYEIFYTAAVENIMEYLKGNPIRVLNG